MRLAAVVAGLMMSASSVTADPVEPITPWNISYEESQCTASRSYGSAEKPITLRLVPSVTGAAMRLLFVEDGKTAVSENPAELTLGTQKTLHTYSFNYDVPTKHHRVYLVNMPMAEFRTAAAASTIGMKSGSFKSTLHVDQLPQMLAELDKCLADLQDYWNVKNIGPARTVPNSGKEVGVFSGDDYPGFALRYGQAGTFGMTILIDQRGRVADCTVDEPSGTSILDVASCYLVEKRAKFLPASDAQGKPTRSAVSMRVMWRISG